MKILVVKRLESSYFAFKKTIDRFITSYDEFIKQYESGTIIISKKYFHKINELLEKDDLEGEATFIIAKQRNGPIGDVPLTFIDSQIRFADRAREHED